MLTILGVSNVSFGLNPAARAVLNAVFLYHCVKAGLDLAIVNPAHVVPFAEIPAEERELAEDLIFNRRPDALPAVHRVLRGPHRRRTQPTAADPMAGHGRRRAAPLPDPAPQEGGRRGPTSTQAVQRRAATPVDVLNNVLLPAMKDVGDKFGAGELILPFVLQSAEVMKKAVAQLETLSGAAGGHTKGKVVLATVFGDVHDIGKNLVNTILTNNGYTVYDLGKQVPVSTIIDKAVEVNADRDRPLGAAGQHHQADAALRARSCTTSGLAASRSSSAARRSTGRTRTARSSSARTRRTSRACSTPRTRSRGCR